MCFVVAVAWEVDLAVATNDLGLLIDKNRCVEALSFVRHLGVAEIETNIELLCRVEQNLCFRTRHGLLKVAINRFFFGHPVTWEKSRQRKFWKHHHLCSATCGFFHHLE